MGCKIALFYDERIDLKYIRNLWRLTIKYESLSVNGIMSIIKIVFIAGWKKLLVKGYPIKQKFYCLGRGANVEYLFVFWMLKNKESSFHVGFLHYNIRNSL